jgi:hypothetical protein
LTKTLKLSSQRFKVQPIQKAATAKNLIVKKSIANAIKLG